ncbi:DNA-binding protein [Aphanothece hegewaldii]|uniref:DNA-binding protein n=1 Tax=Aphanothece hegewaldii TaxID=1521625 RepID=UPI003CCB8A60
MLLIGGLIGCSTLAELGIAVPYLGDPPLNSVNDLTKQKRGTIVYIKGIVKGSAPFLNSNAYQVQDKTGMIWIRTEKKPPTSGKEVIIKGKLDYQSIAVGNQELGEFYVVELEQLEQNAQTPATPTPPTQPTTTPKPTAIPIKPPAVLPQPIPDPTDDLFLPHKQQHK